jgi:CheY-like chemotaxis protein
MAHILVIEDDAQFRQMLAQMLRQDGHQVSMAGDGAEALQMLERIDPNLIITDILMPNKDGIETIMALQQRGCGTPVVAISGGRRSIAAEFNLTSAAMVGVSATLAKPFTRDDLRKVICKTLA